MAMIDPVRNRARVNVLTGFNAAALTIVLSPGEGAKLPDPAVEGAFNLTAYNASDFSDATDDPFVEDLRCTARVTDTLTVLRAQEGTAAADHNITDKLYRLVLAPTKKLVDDIRRNIDKYYFAVLDGASSFAQLDIAGLTINSKCVAHWGHNTDPDSAIAFGPPVGALYVSDIRSGQVDIRSNAYQGANRNIVVEVVKWE